MKKFFVATAAAAALGAAGLAVPASAAEPQRLDEAQMDGVSAGLLNNIVIAVPVNVSANTAVATAIGVLANNTSATAGAISILGNVITIGQSS